MSTSKETPKPSSAPSISSSSSSSSPSPLKSPTPNVDFLVQAYRGFRTYDLNKDGLISRSELEHFFKSSKDVDYILNILDKDHSGFISFSEFKQGLEEFKGKKEYDMILQGKPTTQDEESTKSEVTVPWKIIQMQKHDVVVTWEKGIEEKAVDGVLISTPFVNWKEDMNRIANADPNKPDLMLHNIHIQGVDMFGPRVGFSKFKVVAKKWNQKDGKVAIVPGIIFMRGGAVGILCILTDAQDGREYALTTVQPRVPVGSADFCEIPAGMIDDEKNKFAGKAADEMREETLLQIKQEELFDLTDMAYKDKFRGMYPSAGGCDEFIRLFLYRRYMSKGVLEGLKKVHAGEESEIIRLKLIPIENLWQEAPDAKALSALYLYEKFKERHSNSKPLPTDKALEDALLKKIEGQLAQQNPTKQSKTG